MKALIKLNILFLTMAVCISFTVNAQARKKADKDTEQWRYELECMGIGVQGTYLIKVWSYSKKPNVAVEQSKKNAVHGIVFKGYAGGAKGCTTQKPFKLNPDLSQKEMDAFFEEFFDDGGNYMKYVSLSTDGSVAAGDVLKVNKKEYKVGVVVSVFKDQLRKYLEKENIVVPLDFLF